jgi:hypothetical protein
VTSLSSFDVCNATCLPNIRTLVSIFVTLPVYTATVERSIVLRVKVTEEQLAFPSGLGKSELSYIGMLLRRLV